MIHCQTEPFIKWFKLEALFTVSKSFSYSLKWLNVNILEEQFTETT